MTPNRPLVVCALLALGCAPPEIQSTGDGRPRAGAAVDSVAPRGSFEFAVPAGPIPDAAAGGPPLSGVGNCGFERFTLDKIPPELLLVLDRSGSMLQTSGAGG